MSDASNSDLEEVRRVLLRDDRAELEDLRRRVEHVEALEARIKHLEELLVAAEGRATAVGEVLVDAVDSAEASDDRLGLALQPSVESALHHSARDEGTALADALYPVMGPAMRKMIANLFTFDPLNRGQTFRVEQVLLIERDSGVLLAATASDQTSLEEADVVSGMLDAIRLFVQDAFNQPESDGLQDLRVGDTVVMVEWGPRAVLASVIRGIPDEGYRTRAATALEAVHAEYDDDLESFDGAVERFEGVEPALHTLQSAGSTAATKIFTAGRLFMLAVLICIVILFIVWVV